MSQSDERVAVEPKEKTVVERRTVVIKAGDHTAFPEVADWLTELERRTPCPDIRFTIEVLSE